MRTVSEYRPGRWALLDAGQVVKTTTDPDEAAAWLPPEPDELPGPLFAGQDLVEPDQVGQALPLVTRAGQDLPQDEDLTSWGHLGAMPAPAIAQDEDLTPAPLVLGASSTRAQDPARDEGRGPAWLWLEVNGAGASDWWLQALAIWARKTGRALPERARARPEVLTRLQPVAPAGVVCEAWQPVQAGTAWLGPL